MGNKQNKKNERGIMTILFVIFTMIFAMPFYGIYMVISSDDDEDMIKGVALMAIGSIIWGILGSLGFFM